MQASELRPGQWFEYDNERWLCVRVTDIRCIAVDIDGHDYSVGLTDTVTPLAVTGWDDEPQSEPVDATKHWLDIMRIKDEMLKKSSEQLKQYESLLEKAVHVLEPADIGPQRGPASVAQIEAQTKAVKRELAEIEPTAEQFKAGDYLYCTESFSSQTIRRGDVYKVLGVDDSGWPYFKKGTNGDGPTRYNKSMFRRATDWEIEVHKAIQAKAQELQPDANTDWLVKPGPFYRPVHGGYPS